MKKYVGCEVRYLPETAEHPHGFYVMLQRASDLNWEVASSPYTNRKDALPRVENLCRGFCINP